MIECKNLTNGLRIATAGTYFACCHTFNHPFRDENGEMMVASKHTIDDALDSVTRNEMLKDFANDVRHPACKVCWDAEDAGFVSKRQRDNDTFNAFPERDQNDLFFLELNLGNTCNLSCRICHISASSKWRNFHKVLEPHITEKELDDYVIKYSRAFTDDSLVWDELRRVLPTVRTVDIYGGEPMLMKKQWEIIQECVENGYAQRQQMSFNTNGTIINDKYVDLMKNFQQIRIGFSLDGVGKRFEFLRYYANWDSVKSNIKNYQDKLKDCGTEVIFEICSTISMLNVLYVFDIVDFAIESKIKLMIAFVHNPRHLHIGYMPDEYKPKILSVLEPELARRREELYSDASMDGNEREFITNLLYQAEKVINMLKLPTKGETNDWLEFKRQTKELDGLRNEQFHVTFPELAKIYNIPKSIV